MSIYGNAEETYAERQSKRVNIGEERFVEWAQGKGLIVKRAGFDEKAGYVPQFYRLARALRLIPDFVVVGNGVRVVDVKGSANFKREDYEAIPERVAWYSTEEAPLFYAFCLRDREPIFKTPAEVARLFEAAGEDKHWEQDGKAYRTLDLEVQL